MEGVKTLPVTTIWILPQTTPATCYLCGESIPDDECPLCAECAEDQQIKWADYLAEQEQVRHPI